MDSCGCLSRGSQGKRQEVAECWPGHPQTCNCHMMPFAVWCNGFGKAKERRLIDYALRLRASLLFFEFTLHYIVTITQLQR